MKTPLVGIVMGSTNDWEIMQHAARQLKDFGVAYEARALSAHRTPDLLFEWVEKMVAGGAKCFIAGAGGAAHLAGVVAAKTTLPVLAVPMPSKHLQGLDSLLSMVQMPKGIPGGDLRHRRRRCGQCRPVRGGDAGAGDDKLAEESARLPPKAGRRGQGGQTSRTFLMRT